MLTYIKAQAASILGSLADFGMAILLKEVFHRNYILANIIGNICGNMVQFILSRNWAFHAKNKDTSQQMLKYVLFWAGNILLQAAGLYFFKNYTTLNFIQFKTITSLIVGLTYNYFVQKKFVFA
jgi:putative flippase GtrA